MLNKLDSSDSSKFLCAIKVVDSSLYKENDLKRGKNLNFSTLVVVGERIEDMPIIRQIGDIIRIQKATQKVSKEGEIKFLVDERSNWCLFSPDAAGPDERNTTPHVQFEEMECEDEENKESDKMTKAQNMKRLLMPYKYSGKNFNFMENEEKILTGIRSWCRDFKNSDTLENLISSVKSTEQEENLICKVMKVYDDEEIEERKGENGIYCVRLKDKNEKLWKVRHINLML